MISTTPDLMGATYVQLLILWFCSLSYIRMVVNRVYVINTCNRVGGAER